MNTSWDASENRALLFSTCGSRMRLTIRPLFLAGILALVPARPATADVVPQKAVEVAEAWWSLVDQGRSKEAIDAYFVKDASHAVRDNLAHSLAAERGARPAKPTSRTIIAWLETMDREAPLGRDTYFVMRFSTIFPSGPAGIDELQMIRQGEDDWRVIGVFWKPLPR